MKSILLLAAVAATAMPAVAAPENLTVKAANESYNVLIVAPTDGVKINSTSNWGEWLLTPDAFSVAEYPQYKVVYSTESSEFQLKSVDEAGTEGYKPLSKGENIEVLGSFSNLNGMKGTVKTFAMQAKKSGLAMTIHSAALIKSDGTEVPVNGKVNYGIEAELPPLTLPYTIQYTGQWGSVEVVDSKGGAITFAKGDAPVVFTIKFAAPTTIPLNVEFENTTDAGSIYCPIEAGASEFTFTLDDEVLATVNDGAGTDKIEHMWIKSTGENPGEIVIAKLTRQQAGEVVELPAMYLRGDINSWAADPAYQFQPTDLSYIYTLRVEKMSGAFKIADDSYSVVDYGGNGTPLAFGTATALTAKGADMTLAETAEGTVTFTLDTDAWTLTATAEPSGISEVEAGEAAPSRWFDISGRELSEPTAHGLYIEVRGGKATKVLK